PQNDVTLKMPAFEWVHVQLHQQKGMISLSPPTICNSAIADRQAHAVIPPRKNAKPWKDKKMSSLERNELLRTVKRLGRTIWKKWSGYHRRSLVETKMHCIKLLGDKLSARNFQSQVNEIHARMAVLNKFTDLGRPHTRVVT
uniref:transposase n=1 Tax=Acinetobacter baumannii TaxID=470 RepID=UPI0031D9D07D